MQLCSKLFGLTWQEILRAKLLRFEAWKFDTHSVKNIVLKFKTLQNHRTKVQLCSQIFGPTWHEMLCAILLGFETWKFDKQSIQSKVQPFKTIEAKCSFAQKSLGQLGMKGECSVTPKSLRQLGMKCEMFFAVHSGFEEGKFDKRRVQNMALKLKTLQKYQTEVQRFSKIFGPTWHEMLCSIFLGFEAWKFDRPVFEALQNC